MPGVHETSEMGGVIGGVIPMVRPSTATPITPVAMAGAGAVGFALMTLMSYRTARWLEATDNGMGAEKMRELVSGFLGATIIVASHELERAGALSTRVVEVVGGTIRERVV